MVNNQGFLGNPNFTLISVQKPITLELKRPKIHFTERLDERIRTGLLFATEQLLSKKEHTFKNHDGTICLFLSLLQHCLTILWRKINAHICEQALHIQITHVGETRGLSSHSLYIVQLIPHLCERSKFQIELFWVTTSTVFFCSLTARLDPFLCHTNCVFIHGISISHSLWQHIWENIIPYRVK